MTHGDGHRTGNRSINNVGLGPNTATLAEDLGAKDRIGDIGHLANSALYGSAQRISRNLSRYGCGRRGLLGLRRLLKPVKKSHWIPHSNIAPPH